MSHKKINLFEKKKLKQIFLKFNDEITLFHCKLCKPVTICLVNETVEDDKSPK